MLKTYELNFSKNLELDRRKFLISFSFCIGGMLLFPSSCLYASPVVSAINKIALALGAETTCETLAEFLNKNRFSRSTITEVKDTNQEIESRKILEVTKKEIFQAKVYFISNNISNYPSYFFYLLTDKDKLNACAIFFDTENKHNKQRVAIIPGPSLFGISELAAKVALNNSTKIARQTFLPRKTVQDTTGKLQDDYDQTYVYRSDIGIVSTNYKTLSRKKGNIIVEVKGKNEEILAEGTYELDYTF